MVKSGKRLSLRKWGERSLKKPEHYIRPKTTWFVAAEPEYPITEDEKANANKLLEDFIVPTLMKRAQIPGLYRCWHTMVFVQMEDGRYFFQIGRYHSAVPYDTVNKSTINAAINLAPNFDIITGLDNGSVAFSMLVNWTKSKGIYAFYSQRFPFDLS